MPDIVEALADCLEAMRGGANMNTCLAMYPEYGEDLKPLLEIAGLIKPLPPEIAPSRVFTVQTRTRLLDRPDDREEVSLAPD